MCASMMNTSAVYTSIVNIDIAESTSSSPSKFSCMGENPDKSIRIDDDGVSYGIL